MNISDIPELGHTALGAVGSVVGLLWMEETTWLRRIILFVGGVVFAVVATPDVSAHVHVGPGLVCLMLGMGSMMTMANVLKTIKDFNLGKLARDVAYKWTGVTPSPPTQPVPLPKD
jgi:hypothetical protein